MSYKNTQLAMVNATHGRRWNLASSIGSYVICYHRFIGTDGTVIQTRKDSDRTGCTMNAKVNSSAIHIVIAGDFEHEKPNERQISALYSLIADLKTTYPHATIIGHREASPSACPGKNMMLFVRELQMRYNQSRT